MPSELETAARKNLRTLCIIRLIAVTGQAMAIAWLIATYPNAVFSPEALIWFPLFTLVIAVSWWRSYRPSPIAEWEFFFQVLLDVGFFTALLYETGGATNPFVSYYLVPVTIAAITLPRILAWLVSLLCLAAYTGLLFWHQPIPLLAPEGHGADPVNLHTLGMWINFAVSALLIGYFVTRMADAIRTQADTLNRQREKRLEDDQLIAVATLAASATHELGTPLNTIKLLADDLSGVVPAASRKDLDVLISQVDRCHQTLQELSDTARSFSEQTARAVPVKNYFATLLDRWQLMRPDVDVRCRIEEGPDNQVRFPPSLAASIHNLLNNAADASPDRVDISVNWDESKASLVIRDYGEGFEHGLDGRRGIRPSTKPRGMGLGMLLSRHILARHGGLIDSEPAAGGGTRITINLPLATA